MKHLHGLMCSWSIYAQVECGRYNVQISERVAFAQIFGVDYNAFFRSGEGE